MSRLALEVSPRLGVQIFGKWLEGQYGPVKAYETFDESSDEFNRFLRPYNMNFACTDHGAWRIIAATPEDLTKFLLVFQ